MSEDSQTDFPVVGVGASAGGLEALRDFVKAVPEVSGMCYVIIQHLAPDHPSIMDQLLANHSKIPVVQIEDGQPLQSDTVHVIPAGSEVTIQRRRLRLHKKPNDRGLRTPIDRFFQSLADQYGRQAYCVVLSGTGSDGTAGLRAIKAAGGVAIAQEAQSARFPGMPENAAATGLVDFVLKPAQIASRLQEIENYRADMENTDDVTSRHEEIGRKLSSIIELIDNEEGHDFSKYKTGTLIRRVERRMTILRQLTVDGLIRILRDQPEECSRMLQDFLIGVTQFFRDPVAFHHLNDAVIEPLIKSHPQRVRVWVPGCSTGEECYSIAILLAEALDKFQKHIPVQVFGTDIDLSALARARHGTYPASALEPLTQKQHEQFFISDGELVQAAPRLREMCVFAPHNLIEDPPFSRLDLISCRNVLIYLNSDVQRKIIPRLHYALQESGALFLGPSETLGAGERYFAALNKEYRLFRRNDRQNVGYSSLGAAGERDQVRRTGRSGRTLLDVSIPAISASLKPETSFEHTVEQHVLRHHAPPHAVVSQNQEIIYLSENMAPFVGPSRGVPSATLDVFLVRELRLPVRRAIERSREIGQEAVEENIIIPVGPQKHVVDVIASPSPQQDGSSIIVLRPVRVQGAEELVATTDLRFDQDREILERELALARRQLAAAEAEHEAVDQELRSSNEELLSMNEELQSANEELETSREELQSINEELETINAELTENNQQLTRANSDLKNLFESTEIATLFLDSNLCVRRFTPETARLFGVKERDLGRPLEDLSSKIPFETIKKDAFVAINELKPESQELKVGADRATYLMRTRPYRTIDDRLDGCVVSFIDITQLQEAANRLAASEQRYRSVIEAHTELLARFKADGTLLLINEAYATTFNQPAEMLTGQSFYQFIAPQDRDAVEEMLERLNAENPVETIVHTVILPSGKQRWMEWTNKFLYLNEDGEAEYQAIGRDVTDRKRAETALAEREQRLNFALDVSSLGAWELDVRTGEAERSLRHDQIFGYEELLDDWSVDVFLAHVVPEDRDHVREQYQGAIAKRENWSFECRIRRADGEVRWIAANGRPILDEYGDVAVLLGTVKDITDIKTAELDIRISQARKSLLMQELQHRVKNTLATVLAIIRFSGRRARDVNSLVEALQSRLSAISKTHDLLTQSDWQGGRLSKLVEVELAPYGVDGKHRFQFSGCDPDLPAKQALSLSLALHELATNAAKYGALSNDTGVVNVTCRLIGDGILRIVWEEEGGPMVEEPEDGKEGFGNFLIQNVLAHEISGDVALQFELSGVRCVIEMPTSG
jgi:two-component system CheB/CheR fusion protein